MCVCMRVFVCVTGKKYKLEISRDELQASLPNNKSEGKAVI